MNRRSLPPDTKKLLNRAVVIDPEAWTAPIYDRLHGRRVTSLWKAKDELELMMGTAAVVRLQTRKI